jgi:chromosome segregation ATPase
MPTKKKTSPARRKPVRRARKTSSTVSRPSKAANSFSAMASTQLKQLRKTVDQLKARLEKEARARLAASTVIGEAKKARETLKVQMKALRDQGASLTKELKKAMSHASRRENARQQAVVQISELRAELAPDRGAETQIRRTRRACNGIRRARQGHHHEWRIV